MVKALINFTKSEEDQSAMNNENYSLKSVVGSTTYEVWIRMLQQLIPEGRTHRIAPLIAGMLQYATLISLEKYEDKNKETVAHNLVIAEEMSDFDEIKKILSEPLQQLFNDSNTIYNKMNYQGQCEFK